MWAAVYLIYPLYPYSISRAELPDHPGLVALITHYCSGLSGVSRVMRAAISCPSWYSAFGVGPPDGRHGISEAQGRSQPGNRQAMPGRAGRAGRSPHTRGPDQSSSGACSHRGRGNSAAPPTHVVIPFRIRFHCSSDTRQTVPRPIGRS